MQYRALIPTLILLVNISFFWMTAFSFPSFSTQLKHQEIIEKIQAFDNKLGSFTADFQEIRKFAYDPEEEVFSGKLYFLKPSRVRRDYLSPSKREEVFTEEKAWIYLPKIKQVQLMNFKGKKKIASLPIGLRGPTEDLEKNYDIKISESEGEKDGQLYLMELIPQEGTEASVYYDYIHLWLRDGKWIPAEKIELKEITGDITVLQLSNIVINPKLSSKLFKFNFPSDIEIVDYTQ